MDDQQRDYKEMYHAICAMAPQYIAEIEKSHPEAKNATNKLHQLITDPLCFDSEQPDDGQPFASSAEKTLLISNLKKINDEQEEYIQKLETQVIKMNDWDERSELQIVQLQNMLENVLKKYFNCVQ